MSASETREQIPAVIDKECDYWTSLIAQAGTERMTGEKVDGDWEMRDLIAHLVIWRNRTMGIIAAQALAQPEPEDPWPAGFGDDDDLDAINAWIDRRDTRETRQQLIDAYTDSFAAMRALVERLDDAGFNDSNRVPFLRGSSLADAFGSRLLFGHRHEEHKPAIQAFIAKAR
jgi:hypothetical protein